ncbi:MAG: hypothetical protein V1658_00375, partial [Candidatus Micrarchaeota archaeon]
MGIAESLQEKWESFLQWSDEKGMPFRGISDSLEEKGIPAMPFFIFLILAIALGALYLMAPGGQISILKPKETTILLTLKDSLGRPVPGAKVAFIAEASDTSHDGTTNSLGQITFENLRIGSSYSVAAQSQDGISLELDTSQIAIQAGTDRVDLTSSTAVVEERLKLGVEVRGPETAEGVKINLFDSDGFISESKTAILSATFNILPSTKYFVQAIAPGFKSERVEVSKSTDDTIVITLKGNEVADQGALRVLVRDSVKNDPLKGVAVDVLDYETNQKQNSLLTGDNGYTTPENYKLGRKFKLVAKLAGYVAGTEEATIESETRIIIDLQKISEADMRAIKIAVKDTSGGAIVNPVVKLYDEKNVKISEKNPS